VTHAGFEALAFRRGGTRVAVAATSTPNAVAGRSL